MQLSIIIPACNERERISPMLDAYLAFFNPRYGDEVEYIVAVNGSTDGTEDLIQEYITRHAQVKMVVIPDVVGKGGAVLRGFIDAQGALVGFADADGAIPPESFLRLVEDLDGVDAVIASRWAPGAEAVLDQPLPRLLASRCFNILVRVLLGLGVRDTQCGAKVFKRELIQAILPEITSLQWAIDVDLLYQARRAGYRFRELAISWHHVGGSKVHVVSSSRDMAFAVIRLRLRHSPLGFWVRRRERLGPLNALRAAIMRPPLVVHDAPAEPTVEQGSPG